MATGTIKVQQSGVDIVTTTQMIVDNLSISGSSASPADQLYQVTPPSAGYSLIGIVGIIIENATTSGQGQSAAVVNEYYFTTSQANIPLVCVRIRNVTSSAIKIQVNMQLLWKKG